MNKVEELIQQLCPEGVVYKELGEMTKILNGYAFKSNKYTSSGIRVIRISDVQKGKMSDKDLKYYPIEMMDEFKSYILKENDLVMSLTGNVGRVAMLSERHLPAGLNQRVACIRTKNKEILTRFLFHFFDQNQFEIGAMTNATGGGQKNMSTTWLAKYMIPIPPLPVQQEIVNILDTFTQLEAELEAELEARKKQYEYYRNELLTFGDEVEWKTLGEICLSTNNIQWKDYKNVNFQYIDLSSVSRENNKILGTTTINYQNAPSRAQQIVYKDDVIFGTTRPTLRRYSIITSNYHNQICSTGFCVLRANQNIILPRFLYYILTTARFYNYVEKNQEGASYPSISNSKVKQFRAPTPPISEQERIVGILDRFDALVNDISIGLPAEIEARRKQYEYYREKLLSFEKAE
ncbi:MAG: restriction endonuclease subunit S [Clostridia bacterium]|jgi:type I restriction enzyme S subunit|nr:restriction endonuclease subunit S [Clostridia bacterium]